MPSEPLVFAFHADRLYTFERASRHSPSAFGGPPPAIVGRPFGPRPLHLIARLAGWHIPALSDHHLFDLPLIYGMNYDGCSLGYRLDHHKVELTAIEPAASTDDWPYANYPPLLPYVPLRLGDTPSVERYDTFAARFPNMPEQPPAELVVAVPPPAMLGVSLWAPSDPDGITIVFACDLKKRTVNARNLTS